MDSKHECLERYFINSQRLFQALESNDLVAVNQYLEKNLLIMNNFDKASIDCDFAQTKLVSRSKMEAIESINKQCLLHAEKRCRELRSELESTEKNRVGIIKYRERVIPTPRFLDSKT